MCFPLSVGLNRQFRQGKQHRGWIKPQSPALLHSHLVLQENIGSLITDLPGNTELGHQCLLLGLLLSLWYCMVCWYVAAGPKVLFVRTSYLLMSLFISSSGLAKSHAMCLCQFHVWCKMISFQDLIFGMPWHNHSSPNKWWQTFPSPVEGFSSSFSAIWTIPSQISKAYRGSRVQEHLPFKAHFSPSSWLQSHSDNLYSAMPRSQC